MQEKLTEIRKNRLIEISSSWGLGQIPGMESTIVTKNHKIYFYHKYFRLSQELKEKFNLEDESLSKEIILNDIQFKKIIEFIEKEFENKNFDPNVIMDYNSTIYIDYPNCQEIIQNNMENIEYKFSQLLIELNIIKVSN